MYEGENDDEQRGGRKPGEVDSERGTESEK